MRLIESSRRVGFGVLAVVACSALTQAAPKPAAVFQDHAVLQRDKPLCVWGQADPGEHVAVAFVGTDATAVADPKGHWQVRLPAQPASSVPQTMTVSGGGKSVVVSDLLVGDVWLCSGQSNMVFLVSQADHAKDEIAKADHPLIRHFKVKNAVSHQPAADGGGAWAVCSPATVGGFTAVGYYFAREVQHDTGVPIGLLHASWGGTRVEAWIDPDTYATTPPIAYVLDRWRALLAGFPAEKKKYDDAVADWEQKTAAGKTSGVPYTRMHPREPAYAGGPPVLDQPSGLFNGMIYPFAQYPLRGVLWYQGEDNVARAKEYQPLFAALINGWRKRLGQGDLPFYWVQLPNFQWGGVAKTECAALREAQNACLTMPATGQAVTIDVGMTDNIHPTNKQDVGHRLALIALHRTYGRDIVDTGPTVQSAAFEGPTVRVTYQNGAGKLRPVSGPIKEFQVAGSDRVFVSAVATIDGDAIRVTSDKVSNPVAVRYAWRNSPTPNLFNTAGLPAVPFRSDDW